jgi:hypothetical protein
VVASTALDTVECEAMTIREYLIRRWRYFPLVLIITALVCWGISHLVTDTTRAGRSIIAAPVLGLIAYLRWASAAKCPRCGKLWGDRIDVLWNALMINPAQCENCDLSVDEPMDSPANQP